MRSILFALFVCSLQLANAATYYFSSSSGNDSRTSSEAKNSSTPWKSLSKLNSFFSSLQPGDLVLLKRGDTFYGSITVKKSGTSSSPIVIGAYGSGDKPVVTSLIRLSNWVSKGNGIWESYNSSLSSKVKVVLLNGNQQELGRYPNSNASNKGYLYFESHSGTTSITDQQLTSSTNWTGADVVIRPRRWIMARNLITSHSGTTIKYTASTSYAPTDKYGYFIENSLKTLDKFGEWYYNSSTKKLSVYFGSNTPSSYNIQATTGDDLIYSEKFSYVTFENLNIKGANASALSIRYGSNIYVKNCDIDLSGENGIKLFYHPHLRVEGCTISNSNYTGINMGYNGSDNAIIRNNKILSTSVFPGMTQNGDQAGLGIMSYGNNNVIEYNVIRKVGYNGITFNGNYVTIKNNFIDSFCFIKDDGGAIYSNNADEKSQAGRKVIGNIITNGIGAPDGAYNPWGVPAQGIYLDNGSSYVEITGNTVANLPDQGIFIHNSHHIKIGNNTVYNTKTRNLAMIEQANHTQIRNCTITGNIFFKTVATQKFLYINSDGSNEKQFGTFSGNHYASPSDNNTSAALSTTREYESSATIKTFSTSLRFEYNVTNADKTVSLDASYIDIKNNNYSGSITLKPYTSVVLIKTGKTTSSTSPTVSITSPASNTSFKPGATINITANASDANGSISKVEFYRGTTLISTDNTAPFTCSWQNASAGNYTITAKATDNSGHVSTSAGISISVTSSTSAYPTVSLTSPKVGTTYKTGATINITANANDGDGTIKKVEFYKGSTLLHTESTAPYDWNWQNASAGNYTLTAKATDNSGHITTSAGVSISVTSSTSAYPTVSLTSPKVGTTYKTGATINITANANDGDGTIKKVEFYKGSNLLHTESNAPYTWDWKNVSAGSYIITAKATDNSGNVATSAAVKISVASSRPSIVNNDTSNSQIAISEKIDDNASFDYSLFPNPAVNTIKVNFNQFGNNQKANLSIISMTGSLQKNIPLILSAKTIEINISSLSTGMYIMRLTGDNFNINKKFIKN